MPRLFEWYIEKIHKSDLNSELWARGVVSGHERLSDGMFIHTSVVVDVTVENEIAIIQTLNTKYECRMEHVNYNKFSAPQAIPNFEEYKKKYDVPIKKYEPDLKENEVILVLGNNRSYYFGSFHVNFKGETESLYDVHAHVGTFQDSVICQCYINRRCIDYSYFPYKGCHVEFYSWEEYLKTYIENCGDATLYVTVLGHTYKVSPKDRVLITPQNAEKDKLSLGHTDLYDVWHRENEQTDE